MLAYEPDCWGPSQWGFAWQSESGRQLGWRGPHEPRYLREYSFVWNLRLWIAIKYMVGHGWCGKCVLSSGEVRQCRWPQLSYPVVERNGSFPIALPRDLWEIQDSASQVRKQTKCCCFMMVKKSLWDKTKNKKAIKWSKNKNICFGQSHEVLSCPLQRMFVLRTTGDRKDPGSEGTSQWVQPGRQEGFLLHEERSRLPQQMGRGIRAAATSSLWPGEFLLLWSFITLLYPQPFFNKCLFYLNGN